jgi:uncharacterized membrane protein
MPHASDSAPTSGVNAVEETIVSMFDAGGMTTTEIIVESGLTRGKVSRTLSSLAERGIVFKNGGRKSIWRLTGRKE